MQKWEYNLLRYNPSNQLHRTVNYELAPDPANALGEKGWELVSVMEINGDLHFWFKRPKQ